MTDLLFSLNGTVPLFLIMILGYLLKRTGFLTDEFVAVANKLLFKVTIPVLLFHDLVQVDVRVDFDGRYLLFCAVSTFLSIAVTWILARLFVRRRELVGEFVQGCYRSSAAILGAAFIQNIYGDSSMSGLMILGAVPLYNVFAVVILILEAPERDRGGRAVEERVFQPSWHCHQSHHPGYLGRIIGQPGPPSDTYDGR